ncbi:MAG: hypothetical protein K2N35_06470, partial [Muribaculaceae bacterium]|nr:hypothetical protein [Muribaculaceae bacterium]
AHTVPYSVDSFSALRITHHAKRRSPKPGKSTMTSLTPLSRPSEEWFVPRKSRLRLLPEGLAFPKADQYINAYPNA